MNTVPLSAVVIDPEPWVLSRIALTLGHHGLKIAARPSPEDALDYIARTRPDVVLLGIAFWQDGWGAEILAASPDSVVLPVIDTSAGRASGAPPSLPKQYTHAVIFSLTRRRRPRINLPMRDPMRCCCCTRGADGQGRRVAAGAPIDPAPARR